MTGSESTNAVLHSQLENYNQAFGFKTPQAKGGKINEIVEIETFFKPFFLDQFSLRVVSTKEKI